jgi:hypothetical protein
MTNLRSSQQAVGPLEEWRDIPGWNGFYQVSTHGQVRSLTREEVTNNQWGQFKRVKSGRVLKLQTRKDGYVTVRLKDRARGETYLVHRLVALTFLPQQQGQEVCHNNGNKADNSIANLRWDTRKNNHADKQWHGTSLIGSKNPGSKLTEAQVIAIRKSNLSQRALALKYEVCQQLISQIKKQKIWLHVRV